MVARFHSGEACVSGPVECVVDGVVECWLVSGRKIVRSHVENGAEQGRRIKRTNYPAHALDSMSIG